MADECGCNGEGEYRVWDGDGEPHWTYCCCAAAKELEERRRAEDLARREAEAAPFVAAAIARAEAAEQLALALYDELAGWCDSADRAVPFAGRVAAMRTKP